MGGDFYFFTRAFLFEEMELFGCGVTGEESGLGVAQAFEFAI